MMLIKKIVNHFQKSNLVELIDKSEFHKSEFEFLRYIISDMDINIA
jgi:hypothetical protein